MISLSVTLSLSSMMFFPFYYLLYIQDCNNFGQCRWSTNPDEPLLFVRHYYDRLNILDAEKKTSTLKESIRLSENCNFSRIFALYPLHLLLIQNKIILNSTFSAEKKKMLLFSALLSFPLPLMTFASSLQLTFAPYSKYILD